MALPLFSSGGAQISIELHFGFERKKAARVVYGNIAVPCNGRVIKREIATPTLYIYLVPTSSS